MRADTVQEAVAAHYGISKAELMDVRWVGRQACFYSVLNSVFTDPDSWTLAPTKQQA